ncbi:protein O-mannosyl-transferase TMTC2-like [Littorina saxatilis]|uniref:dolichyl-phosphate-mannose--protein mannosyltransferase n=1 Tax=Littorina saxatilis TaxID=31220 RepID=A0AAN9BNI9_9CAEN
MDLSCLVSAGVSLVLYLNTLSADFAYDDSRAIQKNHDLLPDTPLLNLFYDDFWGTPLTHSGSHKSYRPLCVLTFRLNYYLGALEPWGYHLGNVLCHAATAALFTHLARRLLVRTFPTLVAGLLFAVHPIHTEAVAGIVGRADVLACFFYILTLLCYMRYAGCRDSAERRARRWGWMVCVVMGTASALLTKEQAVTVLATCATYDVFLRHRASLRDVITLKILTASSYRRLLEGFLCLALCGVSLVGFRIYFMGNKPPEFAPSDNPASDSDSWLTRALTFNFLPAFNVWLMLFPCTLSFDWSMSAIPLVESAADVRNMATLALYGCLGYVGVHVVKGVNARACVPKVMGKPHANGNGVAGHHHHHPHSSHIHFSRSQSSSSHLNSSSSASSSPSHKRRISNSSTDSVSDFPISSSSSSSTKSSFFSSSRSLNVLILSLSILMFPFIPASNLFFYVGFVIAERILYIPSMGFCLLVGQGAYLLSVRWRSEGKRKGVQAAVLILILLFSARTWLRNQDWQSEEKLYRAGISVNPAKAWGNLANVLNDKGDAADAEEAYRNALKYRGNMADVHYNLGILLQNQARIEEAMESYKRAISFRPKLTVAHLNLGILSAQTGRVEAAALSYRHCADLDTSNLKDPRLHENTKISCLYNLGRLFADHNRLQEAEAAYLEALKKRPSYYAPQSIQNMLGELYMKMNRFDDAEHWYREALKSKPDHIPAHLTLAKLFQHKKLDDKAEVWFQKAREIDPHDGTIDHHHAQLFVARNKHEEAADMYRAALQKNPNEFDIIFNAANAFRQINDKDSAERLYQQAATIRPKEATAHMNLGAILHMNGKLEQAEQSYLRALALKPDDAITQDNLLKLRNLMSSKGGTAR